MLATWGSTVSEQLVWPAGMVHAYVRPVEPPPFAKITFTGQTRASGEAESIPLWVDT